MIRPTRQRHYGALGTEMDKLLAPKLISECTTNSNFSASYGNNENDQDDENQ